ERRTCAVREYALQDLLTQVFHAAARPAELGETLTAEPTRIGLSAGLTSRGPIGTPKGPSCLAVLVAGIST
ncbi:MAG TPA: hypothetical protein VFY39_12565, partial [Gammaproteobacteria bacterium]|nr:hypothetical protein [Gammaproteobacteria bacterium]